MGGMLSRIVLIRMRVATASEYSMRTLTLVLENEGALLQIWHQHINYDKNLFSDQGLRMMTAGRNLRLPLFFPVYLFLKNRISR